MYKKSYKGFMKANISLFYEHKKRSALMKALLFLFIQQLFLFLWFDKE